jgi:hypothetical protein
MGEEILKKLVSKTPPSVGQSHVFSLKELGIPEEEYGVQWAMIPWGRSRDSQILEECNYEAVMKALKPFKSNVVEMHATHWAVGWVEEIFVKVLDKKGKPTRAGLAVIDLMDAYENYPVFDEMCVSDKEYENALGNIEYEISGLTVDDAKPKPTLARDVYSWLSDNDEREVDNADGDGAYPSPESIKKALAALGHKVEDE